MGKRLLLLLFAAVPLVDLWLLVQVGRSLGPPATLALVLASALVGVRLAQREGRRVLAGWQRSMARGHLPEAGLLEGALVLAGGVLLVLPGVLTDVLGLLLLVPPTRRLAARALRRRLESGVRSGRVHVFSFGGRPRGPWDTARPDGASAPHAFRHDPFGEEPAPRAPGPRWPRGEAPVEEAQVAEEAEESTDTGLAPPAGPPH